MRHLSDEHFDQPLMQTLVQAHANTARGREQLCIADDVPEGRSIIGLHRNRMIWLADQQYPGWLGAQRQLWEERRAGRPHRLVADIRCGNKFTARLHALQQQDDLHPSLLRSYLRWRQHGLPHIPGISVRTAYADSATHYPDPNPEATSVDGYVYRYVTGSTWASLRDGDGNAVNAGYGWFYPTYLDPGSSSGLWDLILRSFFLFDTSAIGAGYTVDAATCSLYGMSGTDGGNFAPSANIYASNPASNTALVNADYAAVSRVPFSDPISYASYSISAYNDFAFNAAGLAAIDPEGISKFSAQSIADATDTEPTWSVNANSYTRARSAEYTGTTQDPKLVVTYTVSSTYRGFIDRLLLGVG
jgi:hypothetical protein